jgi:hypothetical protein
MLKYNLTNVFDLILSKHDYAVLAIAGVSSEGPGRDYEAALITAKFEDAWDFSFFLTLAHVPHTCELDPEDYNMCIIDIHIDPHFPSVMPIDTTPEMSPAEDNEYWRNANEQDWGFAYD